MDSDTGPQTSNCGSKQSLFSSRNAIQCQRRARPQEAGCKAVCTQGHPSWRYKSVRSNTSPQGHMLCQAPTYRIQPLLLVQKLSDVLYVCSQHALLLEKLDSPLGLLIEAVSRGEETEHRWLTSISGTERKLAAIKQLSHSSPKFYHQVFSYLFINYLFTCVHM